MESMSFSFETLKTSGKARLGIIHTPHGDVNTPAFIFCGTKATVKGITPAQLKEEHTQIMLSNTYHLLLQPGSDIIKLHGGLHAFTGWEGPIFTDSGGFQVFSLGYGGVVAEIKGALVPQDKRTLLSVTEDAAIFRSFIDGQTIVLTPEKAIETQVALGADIIVCLDECTPCHAHKSFVSESMRRSKRWAERCLNTFKAYNTNQALLAVLQGGVHSDLRQESADFANNGDFDGFAIGGSLGQTQSEMFDIVSLSKSLLNPNKYVHLLGIGGIKDIFHGVQQGIDTFDCVAPTRIARHGIALIKTSENGGGSNYINLNRARFAASLSPISETCKCYTCQNFTISYIHHLIKAHESLAGQLISIHNIRFMNTLMKDIRSGIETSSLASVQKQYCA